MALGIKTDNSVSTDEIASIIECAARDLISHPEDAHEIAPTMLRGAPGVGKSTIIKSIADKLGIGFIDMRLAEMEPTDLRGIPMPNKETKSTEWLVTADLPRDPESKGILLFDEITSADRALQVASYELILDRRLGNNYKLPNGWYIVAAGNRSEDRAVATTMSSALANRMIHYTLDPNIEDWVKWATTNDVHPTVIGFLRYKPEYLIKMEKGTLETGWPSPRSWARVSRAIRTYGHDPKLLAKAIMGAVGPAVGGEFVAFYNSNCKFDDVLEMLTNPAKPVVIPTKADEKYAFVSAIIYLLWNGKTDADDTTRVSGMFRIAKELSPDFTAMLAKAAMLGNKRVPPMQASLKLSQNPMFTSFFAKYMSEASKRYSL